MNPATATALEISAAVRAGRISARVVTESALARIAAAQPRFNAFTTVTSVRALAEADAVDTAVAAGRDPGALAGAPYAVKNLFDLAGVVTVAGSKINRDLPAASTDATAVAKLQSAGAICVGALNMGEYAYDFVTENAHDGATRNPRDETRSAGGSSGGCGAAVAAGLVSFSIGTDTNGSIRVPSSFCGIWGLKPTYGRLSRGGAFPFVDSLDCIGPFSRSVADLAASYDTLQGADSRDHSCVRQPVTPALPSIEGGLGDLRIAVLDGYFSQGGSPQVHDAVEKVAAELGVTRRTEIPEAGIARAAAFLITSAEAGRLHLDNLKTRAGDFDPGIRDRFLAGALVPASWYLQAQKFRQWFKEHMREIFRNYDVLLAPATPVAATTLGQQEMTVSGKTILVRPNLGLFTQPISFVGLPVVAAPVQSPATLPVAVQLIGAPWRETDLLRVARVLERRGICSAPVSPFTP